MLALLLAHVLADFAFQTDWMIRAKQRGPRGVLPHVVVVALCTLAAVAPQMGAWLPAGLVVIIAHALIDISKIAIDQRVPNYHVPLFVIDQVLHVTVIALAANAAVSNGAPPLWGLAAGFWWWSVGLAVSMFVVGIFLRVLWGGRRQFPSRWWGTVERGLVTTLVGSGWLLAAPLVPLARVGWAGARHVVLDEDARFEMMVGDSVALVIGLLLMVGLGRW